MQLGGKVKTEAWAALGRHANNNNSTPQLQLQQLYACIAVLVLVPHEQEVGSKWVQSLGLPGGGRTVV